MIIIIENFSQQNLKYFSEFFSLMLFLKSIRSFDETFQDKKQPKDV